MISDKKRLILLITAIAIIAIAASYQEKTPAVTISTDKDHYTRGETINILVKNNLDGPIRYYQNGPRFWSLDYYNGSNWINLDSYEGGGFQLTDEDIGNDCYLSFYEQMPPYELIPNSTISDQWNQRICPLGKKDPSEPRTVTEINSTTYRFVFYYGFNVSEDTPYIISDDTVIFSNTFTIE